MNVITEINDGPLSEALGLLPERMDSPLARLQVLTTGLQESRLTARRQFGNGPARGLWQFERGGGVHGVLTHTASALYARELCDARRVVPSATDVWTALETDDVLAAGFARLLYWTDPAALPGLGQVTAAWALYLRTWRPGKPHAATWPGHYDNVRQALGI